MIRRGSCGSPGRRRAWVVVAFALAAGSAAGQGIDSDEALRTLSWAPAETVGEYRARIEAHLRTASGAPLASLAATEATVRVDDALKIASNQPATVGAPDGFGSRVNEGITNFMPLFQFALNAVNTSDDDKSVTVDFNPVRVGLYGAVKLAATIAEPEPNPLLLDQIGDGSRDAQKDEIAGRLSDFDDITWSASYGYQRSDRNREWKTGPRLWGRNAKLYEKFVKELMQEVFVEAFQFAPNPGPLQDLNVKIAIAFSADPDPSIAELAEARIEDWTLQQIARLGVVPIDDYRRALIESRSGWLAVDERLAEYRLESIADLIENQPQWTVTASRRQRDDLVGADELVATLKLELGRRNFNRVLAQARRSKSLLAGYRNVVDDADYLAKDRFSLALTYNDRDDYRPIHLYDQTVTDPGTGLDSTFARSAALVLEGSSELCGKLQWGRTIRRRPVEIDGVPIHARLDATAEFVDVRDDPTRQDRFIGKLSYSMPLRSGIAIPITLTYANKSEFLGRQDEELSAHLGLTYALDRLFGQ